MRQSTRIALLFTAGTLFYVAALALYASEVLSASVGEGRGVRLPDVPADDLAPLTPECSECVESMTDWQAAGPLAVIICTDEPC